MPVLLIICLGDNINLLIYNDLYRGLGRELSIDIYHYFYPKDRMNFIVRSCL